MSNHQQQDSRERCRGFAILFAVLTASVVLTIGLALFNITLKEFVLSTQVRDSQLAFYAADTGLECALYWDLEHPGYEGGIFGSYANTLSDGLVGYWKFNDGSGTTANDTSGNNHTGTLVNMDPATDWVMGKIGLALDFDGVNDYVNVVADEGLDLPVFTLMGWFRTGNATEFGGVVTKNITSANRNWWVAVWQNGFAGHAGGSLVFRTSSGGVLDVDLSTEENNADGGWHHFAAVLDGTNGAELYLDGTPRASSVPLGPVDTPTVDVHIGDDPSVAGRYFEGELDEVRIYNRALSGPEVNNIYTATAPTTFVGPIGAESGTLCKGKDITSVSESAWNPVSNASAATTTFNVTVDEGANRCAAVMVTKAGGATRIESRGYNTCDVSNPRRIERALRATY